MPTHLKPLDEDTHDVLQRLVYSYFDGHCYELAIALNRGLDWPMVGLQQVVDGDAMIRHAAVRHPEGGFFDARGRVCEDGFLSTFGPAQLVEFPTENAIKHRTGPILERGIQTAGKLAMSLWPDLPWQKDTYIRSVIAFIDDLERLCRRHGFWVSATLPTQWPTIRHGEGDETGYELAIVGNGLYSVNRMLKEE